MKAFKFYFITLIFISSLFGGESISAYFEGTFKDVGSVKNSLEKMDLRYFL